MKTVVKRIVRSLGFEVTRRTGTMRVASMDTALDWLESQDLGVRTVLDVGASDGRWSADCMRRFPNARFVLYEPNPVHHQPLETFRRHGEAFITVETKAVGAQDGTTPFNAADAFGGALVDAGQVTDEGVIDVEVTTLDGSVARLGLDGPFLLKLDTHGFERGILAGAELTLAHASVLIIEAYAHRLTSEGLYFWELCELLHGHGFRPADLVDVMHRERDGSLWQMDLVFLRESWSGFNVATFT